MPSFVTDLRYLLPWQFSPTIFVACALAVTLYVRGMATLKHGTRPVGFWRAFTFFLGVALSYAMLQTYVDYLSAHMFWIHRFQHLILHHVGPVLIVLAAPERVLRAGVPSAVARRARIIPVWIWRPFQFLFRLLQHPLIAPTLFVGLIAFWLTPSIHFTAMLDTRRYDLMNWSMLADGLLFWWLMLAPRQAQGSASISYGTRLVILALVTIPQLLIGAYITLHTTTLYDVYAVCGRAWAISPLEDQQLGGLLTWIPAGMMSLVGIITVLHHILHDPEAAADIRPRRGFAPAAQPARGA
ncbi:MAG: cytochrome c oxidase assembly protein [Steroidobacteraceae bacterium]